MVLAQALPPATASYAAEQRRQIIDAVTAVRQQWRRIGNDFDAGWALIAPSVIGIMDDAQRTIAAGAVEYIPTVMEATGQLERQLAEPDPSGLIGVTGGGLPSAEALAVATVRAKQSVAAGASTYLALLEAGKYLSYVAGTMLSDTGRAGEGLAMQAYPSRGWVRVLSPPSCSRCVILAGRVYRHSSGFFRHPGCDCRHQPANDVMAEDLTIDPIAYYDSLDPAGRLKFAGSRANLAAIESGADINQIVNAYRRTAGMQFAQVSPIKLERGLKFTTEGATKRSVAYRAQQSLRRNGPVQARLMPESIYMRASSPEDAIRMLKLYGWINKSGTTVTRGSRLVGGARPGGVLAPRGRNPAVGGSGRKPPTGPPAPPSPDDFGDFEEVERPLARLLVAEGRTVTRAPQTGPGRHADALVDGELTEFKTMAAGGDSSTVRNELNNSKRRGGQARHVIIDARSSGLTRSEAERGLARSRGLFSANFDTVRIVGSGYDVSW